MTHERLLGEETPASRPKPPALRVKFSVLLGLNGDTLQNKRPGTESDLMLDHRIMHPDLFLLAEGDFENVMCFDILKDSAFAITSILEPLLQFPVQS